MAYSPAKGRLDQGPPIAVIDIGSNSIRLVVYEGLTRSPTPVFNEKVLAGLGREVQSTGLLAPDSIKKALAALKRFRALCDALHVRKLWVIATAACRDARNGRAFIAEAQRICRVRISLLSGKREARLTALGVIEGIYNPDGIVGDLGGGSLELVEVKSRAVRGGLTLPLGGLALRDAARGSIRKARSIVEKSLRKIKLVKRGKGRTLYLVGGTWRALARLHVSQTGYLLHVMHGYRISAREAREFAALVHRAPPDALSKIKSVSSARRPLLPYAALVLEHLIRKIEPRDIVISTIGVREGLLYSLLSEKERRRDPLISAAHALNTLRSRSPRHGEDLIAWTDRFMASTGLAELPRERRLRHAACLLADTSWRAHPDYRGEQSMNITANAAFVGIDHPGRAFLALTMFFRHTGLSEDDLSPRLRELSTTRMIDRARILGAAMRVAYLLSAGQGRLLPDMPMRVERGKLTLRLPRRYRALSSDRVFNRLNQLARLIGRDAAVVA